MVQFLITAIEFLATIAMGIFGIDYTPEMNCEAAFYPQNTAEIITYADDGAEPQALTENAVASRGIKMPVSCLTG